MIFIICKSWKVTLCLQFEKHISSIGHIQLADTPGRHEPGTGEINYPFLFGFLDRVGYDGWIGCEYIPANKTEVKLCLQEKQSGQWHVSSLSIMDSSMLLTSFFFSLKPQQTSSCMLSNMRSYLLSFSTPQYYFWPITKKCFSNLFDTCICFKPAFSI